VDRLSPLGFDLFPIIVVDLLHEFELGILKAVMTHLMRLLYAVDPGTIIIINERYGVGPRPTRPSPYVTHLPGFGLYLHLEKIPFDGSQRMFHQ